MRRKEYLLLQDDDGIQPYVESKTERVKFSLLRMTDVCATSKPVGSLFHLSSISFSLPYFVCDPFYVAPVKIYKVPALSVLFIQH